VFKKVKNAAYMALLFTIGDKYGIILSNGILYHFRHWKHLIYHAAQ